MHPGWHVEEVTVVSEDRMECWFPCNFWLKPPAELSREVRRAISVAYSVHVNTADEYQAGTDSAVYIR